MHDLWGSGTEGHMQILPNGDRIYQKKETFPKFSQYIQNSLVMFSLKPSNFGNTFGPRLFELTGHLRAHLLPGDVCRHHLMTPLLPAAKAANPSTKSSSVKPSGVRTQVTPGQCEATLAQLSP